MLEVDLRADLLPRHREVLRALGHLSTRVETDTWCLVGGLMVVVATRAAAGRIRRAEGTKDGDILVDVCAQPNALNQVAHVLTSFGFEQEAPFPGAAFARCTFSGYSGQIDVLCPDDAPDDLLETSNGVVSLAIPGGRRALEVSERVRITYDDESPDAELRVPLLPWAIVVKAAAAIDPKTSAQERHIQDVAGMLAVVASHPLEHNPLAEADRSLLGQLSQRLDDDSDVAWEGMPGDGVLNARAGYRLLHRSEDPHRE